MRFLRLFHLEEGDVSDCLGRRLGPLYPLFCESGPDEKASSSQSSNVNDVDNVLLSSSPQSVNSEGISWEGFRYFDSDSELDLDLQSLFLLVYCYYMVGTYFHHHDAYSCHSVRDFDLYRYLFRDLYPHFDLHPQFFLVSWVWIMIMIVILTLILI